MFFLPISRTESIMYETAQFTSFEDWLLFGNFILHFTATYCAMEMTESVKLPGRNSSQIATTRVKERKRDLLYLYFTLLFSTQFSICVPILWRAILKLACK